PSTRIRCLPARLLQASAVRTTPIGLALTPVDGVPIGVEAVALRHVVLWEEAILGLDMTCCRPFRPRDHAGGGMGTMTPGGDYHDCVRSDGAGAYGVPLRTLHPQC